MLGQVLDDILVSRSTGGCITATRHFPARAAVEAPFPPSLDPRLGEALRARGITALYSHQARAWEIAENGANLVLTNPDMLHSGILPHHTKWAMLFQNLRFVVIDELHAYRGVFGSHVADVIRRLRRICRHYGANPQFIMASATIANPGEHAG